LRALEENHEMYDRELKIRTKRDVEYLRDAISSEPSENPTFEELKKIFISYSFTDWNIGKDFIKDKFNCQKSIEVGLAKS